jgi:pimeloyl-ACP methyl ester carboxylesterase
MMTMLDINDVAICVETFGDPAAPAILLIHGASASMLWWESELCERIAAAGRFVIRYDNRDTGRSTSYPPGHPGYSFHDMANDAIGILDALRIGRAHIVGRSMSGAIALVLGVEHPDRVASLTFVATTSGDDDLPPMSQEFIERTSVHPDFANPSEVVDYIVGVLEAYSGPSPYFDEPAMRALAEQDVARTRDIASAILNHFLLDFDRPISGGLQDVRVPTLIVHGECDPVFPLPHGQSLRDAIPGATLVVLEKGGHEVPRALWDVFVAALIAHTAGGVRASLLI